MENIIIDSVYGKGVVWRFYNVDEAENYDRSNEKWRSVVAEFKKRIGTFYAEGEDIVDGNYGRFKIIGVEDNIPYANYFWILEDEYGNRSYKVIEM